MASSRLKDAELYQSATPLIWPAKFKLGHKTVARVVILEVAVNRDGEEEYLCVCMDPDVAECLAEKLQRESAAAGNEAPEGIASAVELSKRCPL
jgi:hypothetical protein